MAKETFSFEEAVAPAKVFSFEEALGEPAAANAPATEPEVVTSARPWQGAGAGRGGLNDPRRLDVARPNVTGSVLDGVNLGRPTVDYEANLDAMQKSASPGSVMFSPGRTKQAVDKQIELGELARRAGYESIPDYVRAQEDSERRQQFAEDNPNIGALASGLATMIKGTLNAIPAAAGFVNKTLVDPFLGIAGARMSDVPTAPGTSALDSMAKDFMPAVGKLKLADAWDGGVFKEWLAANVSAQVPQIAQSVYGVVNPAAVGAILPMMGAQAAGGSFAEGDDPRVAVSKGIVEMLSEGASFGVAEKVKTVLQGLPSAARQSVLRNVAQKALAVGGALTAQQLAGAVEESVAQLGGNALDIYASGKQKSMLDGVPEAAVIGAAVNTAMALPNVAEAARSNRPEDQAARELARELERGNLPPGTVETLNPNLSQPAITPKTLAGLTEIGAAASVDEAIIAAARATTPQAQAVDNIGRLLGDSANVSQPGNIPPVDSGAAGAGAPEPGIRMEAGVGASGAAGPALDAGGVRDQPAGGAAPLATGRGAELTPDIAETTRQIQELEGGATTGAPSNAAIAQPKTAIAKSDGEPASVWFGRRGDGYQTPEDAQSALPTRTRISPELDWRVEQMPTGRYRLAGYDTETRAPTFTVRMNPTGTATVLGNPKAIAAKLAEAGITEVLPNRDGVTVATSQAQAAAQFLGGGEAAARTDAASAAIKPVAPPANPPTQAQAGLPAEGAGVSKKDFKVGGRDPHDRTYERRSDGRLTRSITYPDGQTSTETFVTDKNGDETWVSNDSYEKGEFYPVQMSQEQAAAAIRDDMAGKQTAPTKSAGAPNPPAAQVEGAGVSRPAPAAAPQEPAEDTTGLPGFEPGDTLSRFGPRGLKGNSWMLRNKTTGEVIQETSNPAIVRKLNTEKYEAVPIGQHLADINRVIKQYGEEAANRWMRGEGLPKNPQNVDTSAQPAQKTPEIEQVGPFGRDLTPIAQGGKPFKTKAQADAFRKANTNNMRTVKQGAGFVLRELTAKELAAREKAAKRLAQASTSPAGVPIPAHAFIAGKGGLAQSAMADAGFDRNMKVGNRWLFAGAGKPGLTLAEAAEMLAEAGYIREESEAAAADIIKRSMTSPQYTAEGWERIAEAEQAARFEDHLAAQQEAATEEDPFGPAPAFTPAEVMVVPKSAREEYAALIDAIEAAGLDVDAILEEAARITENLTQEQYSEYVRQALTDAIANSRREADRGESAVQGREDAERSGTESSSSNTGRPGDAPSEADEGLTAPTQQDVLAQQDRREQADDLDQREQIQREASGFQLQAQAPEQRRDNTGDMFGGPTAEDVARARDGKREADAVAQAARDAESGQGGLFASEPTTDYTGGYETDLFGEPLPAKRGNDRSARPVGAGVRGNAQPNQALRDTPRPEGDFYVNTIVGSEVTRKLGARLITSASDAATATSYLYKSAVERLDGIVTDRRGKPLAVIGGFKGANTQASVYPATLLGEAVRIPGAAYVWFSHNHPSGTPTLSSADLALNDNLTDAFRGSGIEPQGLLAVSGGGYGYVDAQGNVGIGGDILDPSESVEVPVVERQLGEGRPAESITAPAVAIDVAKSYYAKAKGSGIILLDSQLRVAGWVPISEPMTGELRGTGALNALYRALSQSNAVASIIVHGGELDGRLPGYSQTTILKNIAHAMMRMDVKTLDVINVKSSNPSLARAGVWDGSNKGPMFSRAQPFYSALSKSIEGMTPKALPGAIWKDGIKGLINKGAVKEDEVEWSGIREWLDLQTGKVSKEDVLAYLDANGVQVQEVVLGDVANDRLPAGWVVEESPDEPGYWEVRDAQGIMVGDGEGREAALANVRGTDTRSASETKYSQYTLPGGPLSRDTEILSRDGWLRMDEVQVGDVVMTRRDEDGVLEWQEVEAVPTVHAEKLYHFKSQSINMRVTACHNMLVKRRRRSSTGLERVKADRLWTMSEMVAPLSGVWMGAGDSELYGKDAGDVAELIGWYIAEGSAVTENGKKSTLSIAQSRTANPEKCARIESLLDRLGISWNFVASGPSYYLSIKTMDRGLVGVLHAQGDSRNKFVPGFMFEQPTPVLARLMEGMLLGDGCRVKKAGRLPRWTYHTNSKQLADDMQVLALMTGSRGTISRRANGLYTVAINAKQWASIDDAKHAITDYNDIAYCVTVKNHAIYVRTDGVAAFTGNSNYREVLLTLPPSRKGMRAEQMSGRWVILEGDTRVGFGATEDLAWEAADRNSAKAYKSSHWDQPGVLAHIRLNDRVDSTGAKTLLVEEIQSDYGQDFKKQRDAINKAVDDDFEGIIQRMKKAGVLEVNCD